MYNVPPPVDITQKSSERIRDWYDKHVMEYNKNPKAKDFLELSIDDGKLDFSKLKIYLVPFLGKNTEKFIFTFFSFLKSPFSSIEYDQPQEPPKASSYRQTSKCDNGETSEYSESYSDYSDHSSKKNKSRSRAAKRHHKHRSRSSSRKGNGKSSSTSSSKHRYRRHRNVRSEYYSDSDYSEYSYDDSKDKNQKIKNSNDYSYEQSKIPKYSYSAEKAAMITLVKQLIQQNRLFESDDEMLKTLVPNRVN